MKDSTQTKQGNRTTRRRLSRFLVDYGMLGVLAVLCLTFSILTVRDQFPIGVDAAHSVADAIQKMRPMPAEVIIVSQTGDEDRKFADAVRIDLRQLGIPKTSVIAGDPSTIRSRLSSLADSLSPGTVIAATHGYFPVVQSIVAQIPELKSAKIVSPRSYRWPTFLLPDNIRNVANQITVIAIIAIGMTMVIITAGIDLSVGSLIALSAVVTAWLVEHAGGEGASVWILLAAAAGGIAVCGLTGAFSGFTITRFRIPPFIATLAMMQVAAGLAYIISQGKPIYRLPDSFIWLGRGVEPVLKIPVAVILMVILYIIAHIIMTRTTMGRYIYAVGGNMEAARLSGIRVRLVLFLVYTVSGVLAGLGGIIMASQLKSGAPTYGLTYELYVIAAVVVGGASLSGGRGNMFGTLIGAFLIGVIQNGMNLTNVESYTQKVVLGLVILGAVLLDGLKHRGFHLKGKARRSSAESNS
jgi:ribose transport system permease protein